MIPLPATDLSVTGLSRWTIVTARVAALVPVPRPFTVEPFAEIGWVRFTPTLKPSAFDPAQFYGADRIWSFSVGATLKFGMKHMRMGRYGVATTGMRSMKMAGMEMDGMQ
jgi:hypothetical protein